MITSTAFNIFCWLICLWIWAGNMRRGWQGYGWFWVSVAMVSISALAIGFSVAKFLDLAPDEIMRLQAGRQP